VSVYSDLLEAVRARVQSLGLPGIAAVAVMKLPAVEEELDTLPLIAIVPAEEDAEHRPYAYDNQAEVVYPVEVVAINTAKRLLGAEGNESANDDLSRHTGWQERVRHAFYNPRVLGLAGVWKTEIRPGKPVDRGAVNQAYSYVPVTLRFRVLELGAA
jgi:hypothetical protein